MIQKKVKLFRTEAEWDAIKIKMSKKNFSSFVRSEIKRIAKKYNECPKCVTPAEGCKIEKEFSIDESDYALLGKIAKKMGKPLASVIDDFIIVPLLTP